MEKTQEELPDYQTTQPKRVDKMISTSNCRNKPSSFTSVQDNDVMIEILIRLPLKSLLKFKCVCKWWCRLISDPVFLSNYSHRNPNLYVSGFCLQKLLFLQMYSELQFITFDGENDAAPKPSLSFIEDEGGVFIRHSCNGLLLCSSFRCLEADRIYYVCKPTTKQYHRLPKFRCKNVFGTSVLCDPSKLTQYRIIFVCDSELSVSHRQIKMYHSDDGLWRESGNPFFASDDILFNRGVFWNGALHWVGRGELALSFDVEQECLHEMPMPPVKEGWAERRLGYFGESGDHLYLIEIYGPLTAGFDVMEMKRDYSGWFVKYHVNINAVAANYPIMVRQNVQEMHHFVFSLMHVIHRHLGEKEESILVLHIPGKFISYNLIDETFMDLGNVSHCLTNRDVGLGLEYSWEGLYPYVNTLSYL